MNRSEAILVSVLSGLVLLVVIGGVFVLVAPAELLFGPAATDTPAVSPTPTPTPTFPNFMPTASLITPTPAEPTPASTRLPTASPVPLRTPTAAPPFSLPTLAFRPTETPTRLPPPAASTRLPTATLIPARQYTISFKAEKTALAKGECTNLVWRVEGQVTVQLNGEGVDPVDTKEICPKRNTDYVLTTQVAGSAEVRREIIRISVEE